MSVGWASAVDGAERRSISLSVARSDERRWVARLDADRPLVLLSVVFRAPGWRWAKSGVAAPHHEVGLAFGGWGEGSSLLNLSFGTDADLLQAQTAIPTPEECVRWEEVERLETGRLCRLVRIEGQPLIEAGVLVLSKEDVRFGRNHLWRPGSGLSGDVAAALTRGRVGVFSL